MENRRRRRPRRLGPRPGRGMLHPLPRPRLPAPPLLQRLGRLWSALPRRPSQASRPVERRVHLSLARQGYPGVSGRPSPDESDRGGGPVRADVRAESVSGACGGLEARA